MCNNVKGGTEKYTKILTHLERPVKGCIKHIRLSYPTDDRQPLFDAESTFTGRKNDIREGGRDVRNTSRQSRRHLQGEWGSGSLLKISNLCLVYHVLFYSGHTVSKMASAAE